MSRRKSLATLVVAMIAALAIAVSAASAHAASSRASSGAGRADLPQSPPAALLCSMLNAQQPLAVLFANPTLGNLLTQTMNIQSCGTPAPFGPGLFVPPVR
jgi:hypothetical protein